jgi:hypothetical protein
MAIPNGRLVAARRLPSGRACLVADEHFHKRKLQEKK